MTACSGGCGRATDDDDPNATCRTCTAETATEPSADVPDAGSCAMCGGDMPDQAHAPYCCTICAIDAERD